MNGYALKTVALEMNTSLALTRFVFARLKVREGLSAEQITSAWIRRPASEGQIRVMTAKMEILVTGGYVTVSDGTYSLTDKGRALCAT